VNNEEKPSMSFSVRLCSDKAAFEVRIQRKVFFNMDKVRQLFEACHDHEIVVHTPHMIILKSGRVETTLSSDGRMLIKRVANESEATQVALKILRTAQTAAFKP